MRSARWLSGLLVLVGAPAYGQSFNIDVGGSLGTPPDSSYGAGTSQVGYWNAPDTATYALRDLSGSVTAVMFAGTGANVHPIAGATGNDARLMDTTYDLAPSQHVSIKNLAGGDYDLYAYSWAQIAGGRTVGFSVFNGTTTVFGSVTYGLQWPGGQVEGVTFARMRVQVLQAGDNLTLNLGSGHDYDVLAGIQLVPVPAPGSSLIGLGVILVCARRRR